jgi:hypothetical protein
MRKLYIAQINFSVSNSPKNRDLKVFNEYSFQNQHKINQIFSFHNLIFRSCISLLFILIGLNGVAQNPISRIQFKAGSTGASAATTIAITMNTAPVNGNTLIAVISTRGTTASRVSSITQTGATWTKAAEGTNTNGSTTEIWSAPNISGAATAITINQASLLSAAVIMEYNGILTPTPLDKIASTTGNSAAASTGTTTTTAQANELLIGGIGLVSSGYTLGTITNSFTSVTNSASTNATATSNANVYALERIVTATLAATTGGTVSTSSQWSGAIATFRAAAINTAGTASTTPTLCISTALTAITHTTTGATGIGTATGLPAGVTAAWATNVITISGTPTVSGTFNYSIPLTGGAGFINATGTITVTPANTVGAASSTPTLCINTALTAITHATTGATGIGTATGLPTGVTAAWATNVITISGTPTASGTFNYSIPLTGGCGSVNATGTITVTPANTAGAASSTPTLCINTPLTAITHTTTGATGIGTATGLPAGVTAAWATNVITISGTPTASGTFNYTIPLTGGCGAVNATGTITVTPANTSGVASSTPTLCINTALTAITHATTGATGIGTATGLPAGVTAAWAANLITISGTPTASGTFNYTIPLTGGCGAVNATGTITVTQANTVGAASSTPTLCINTALTAITHTTTGATGIGTATGLPAGVTAAWATNVITISGTPTASGTFNYTIPLTGGCGSVNATGTITVSPVNTPGTASSTPTLCINTALTNITRTTTGATGVGTATGLPAGVTTAWAANVITISGTPTASGTFNYSIPLTGGCGSVNATGTITVTPANTAGVASSTPTLCINTALTAITHATTGATGIGTATGLPTGVTAAWAANVITISGTPTASGTFNYSIPLTGGCGSVNATGTITVNPVNTPGTASSTPTLCINTVLTNITRTTTGATGIGSATGLPTGVTAAWASNVITISGTPTASGTFNYSIPLTGGCGSVNATGTIIVTPANTAGVASSTPTLCINTALTAITHATTGATAIGTATGLPTGVTAAWAANVITISGTPTASGTFNYSIPLTGGCGSVNATGTITVTPANTAGVASSTPTLCINTALTAITHATTGATAIGTATGLPAGVTAAWAANVITISGTPTASGTFNYSIPLTGGCGSINATGTITVTPANTAGVASSTPTLCINTALTAITHATTGATGIGTASGLPAGVTAAWAANLITISGTPTASGTFNYSIPLTGGCGAINAIGTITVSSNAVGAASSTPTLCINTALTAITHSTTGATGIGTATGLPAGVTAAWAANVITISGTPTASGTFNYSIPLTGGCGAVNATGTITVSPVNTPGTASSTPTLCINTALTNITRTTTGATGIGTASGLPAGVNAAWAANVITISGTPTVSGTFNYSIPLNGGCGSVNATGTITVSSNTVGTASSTPSLCLNTALTAITHTTTGATGIGTATGLPAAVTAAWAANVITISGTPTASGTFNYSIPLTGGCGSVNATGTITVNGIPSVTLGTNLSICSGVTTGSFSYSSPTNGANEYAIDWTAAGLAAGLTNVGWTTLSGGTISLTGLTTTSGTYPMVLKIRNSTSGCSVNIGNTVCGTANENGTVTLSTPTGVFNSIDFASYGNPNGSCGSFTLGTCHASTSLSLVSTAALGNSSFSIVANNATFGDPCSGTGKRLYVQAYSGMQLIVTPLNTPGTASSTPTLCINTPLTAITRTTTGATGIGTATGLPAGVTAAWAANVITISGTPTAAGTFNYSIPLTGGCGSVNATGTITVTSVNSAGTASTTPSLCTGNPLTGITHSTTGATGIGTATGLPAGVTAAWAANVITISGTPTAAGTFNYSIPLTSGCGSVNATGTITVSAAPTANAGAALAAICQNATSAALGGSVGGSATGGIWTSSVGGTFNSGATNLNTTWTPPTNFTGSATLTITTSGGGCTAATASKNITVNPLPAVAGTISGTSTVCAGQTAVAFSIPTIANATTYTWTYSGTGLSGTTTTASFNGAFSTTATSGNLIVVGVNTCGNGTVSANYAITVNPLPGASGAITGTAAICQGQSGIAYSVGAITNATSYTWAYSGTGFTPSASTASITGTFATNATAGNLTVSGVNSCGTGTVSANFAITSSLLPSAAGAITGTATVCKGQSGFAFSVPTITNATTYSWSYSGTGCTFSGNTAAITASFSNTATSGNITVRGVNACGNGVISATFPITVTNPPSLTINADYCDNNGFVILTASAGFTSFLWNTTATTSFINADIAGTYTLIATNSNGCTANASIGVATELVTNGKFDAGNTGFTTAYTYVTDGGGQTEMYPEGTYAVVPSANSVHNLFYGTGHTPGGGNYMVVNGSVALGTTVWSQNSITVQPNTTYYFSAWGLSVNNGNKAVLRFSINGSQVGSIAFLPNGYSSNTGPYNWTRFYGSWNSGFSTTANLSILNLNTVAGGNDFGLDDISFGTLSPVALSVSPGPAGSGICQGSPLVLQSNPIGGASPYTYAWTGPNSFTSTDMNPQVTSSASGIHAGVYTLTLTDGFGCTTTGSYNVSPSALPSNKTATAVTSTICMGGTSSIDLAASEVGVSYQLRNNATGALIGDPIAGTGGTINFPLGTLTTTTTYNVLATGNLSTCSVQMTPTVTITVATTPVLAITNQIVCSGTANLTGAAVTAGSTGGGTLSYWTNASSTTSLSNPSSVAVSGIYYIKSTVGSCFDIEPVTVSINAAPTATFSYPTTPYCTTESDPVAVMTGSSIAGVFSCTNAGLVFLNTATGLIDLSASTPGTYTVTNTVVTVGACADVSATSSIVITLAPLTGFSYSIGTDFCQVVSAINPAPTFAPGAAAGTFGSTTGLNFVSTATGVINIASSTPGNYAIWNTRAAVGGCLAESDTIFVDINPYVYSGNVSVSSSTDQICSGQSVDLFSTVQSYNGVLLRERFNGTVNNWVRTNTSTGGTVANAAYTLRPEMYAFNSVSFSSNDNTQYYLTNSEAQAGTITTTILRSPVMNTTSYSNLNLDFFHYFQQGGNATATVQVSLNNATWTTVATYNSTQGTSLNFANATVNLSAYIGQPIFYVRFRYTTTAPDKYWAIDNVSLTGTCSKYSYNWFSAPVGYTSTASDPTGVSPTVNTFYVLNAVNTFGCTTPSSPLPITVNAIPTLTSTLTPPAICGNTAFTYTPTSSLAGATFTWTRPAVSGISNAAITTAQASNPNETLDNTTNSNKNVVYNYIVTNNGCNQNYAVTVAVKPAPAINLGTNQTVCNGSSAQLSSTITNGLAITSYAWSPTIGLSNATIANPTATVIGASQAYTLTANATNGCSNTSAPFTVTNFGFGGTVGLWTGNSSSNWNNCLNWANGQVPTASTSVTIDGTAITDCQITDLQSCAGLTILSSSNTSRLLNIATTGGLTVSGNVAVQKTSGTGTATLNIDNGGQFSCNNLTLTGTATGSGNALFKKENASSNIIINGALTIAAGGKVDLNDGNNVTTDGTINIKGNFVNNSLITDLDQGNANIIFNGTGLQQIICPNGQQFYNVILNNSAAISLRLTNNIQILNQLTLTNGKIDLNSFNLNLGSTSSNALISGGSNNSYIISWDGTDNGSVIHNVNSVGSTYRFPIGDLSNYTPFQLTLNSATLSAATLTAKINVATHPSIVSSTNYLGRYWTINPTGITNPNYNVVYNYAVSDIYGSEGTLFPAKYNSGGWQSCIESASSAMIGSGNVNVTTKALSWNGITSFSEFTGIGNGTPLPIELLTFTADPTDNEVLLNWTTASEINNHYFEIERSIDTKNAKVIGKVDGAGNSNALLTYNLIDKNPESGISYYRLKQVDYDGKFTYSEWVPVKFEGEDKMQLTQFAVNREASSINFSFRNLPIETVNATITVFDVSGRLVYDQAVSNISQTWIGNITLGNISKGNYIARFGLGTQTVIRKFYY